MVTYEAIASEYAAPLARLARAYEADPDRQRDLLQDIHLALWRSLSGFQSTCSVRTWVYRVAHNVAASHILRQRRHRTPLVSLEDVEASLAGPDAADDLDRQQTLDRLYTLIRRLQPLDRQIILLYLEGSDAASIAEIAGLSARAVGTRIHRIKRLLVRRYQTET